MQRVFDRTVADRRRFPVLPASALALLICACGASDGSARKAAIQRLEAEPTEKNLRAMRSFAGDPDRDVRAVVLHALVAFGASDSARLIGDGLTDPDGFVRATAVRLAADRQDPQFVRVLIELLTADPDPAVRQSVAEALVRLGGTEAASALVRALGDPLDRVRRAAVEGLRVLGPAAARQPLTHLLTEDPVWEVRADAARALGAVDDLDVVASLRAALADQNEFVRAAAASALGAQAGARAAQGAR